jgi:hypothetical protein
LEKRMGCAAGWRWRWGLGAFYSGGGEVNGRPK